MLSSALVLDLIAVPRKSRRRGTFHPPEEPEYPLHALPPAPPLPSLESYCSAASSHPVSPSRPSWPRPQPIPLLWCRAINPSSVRPAPTITPSSAETRRSRSTLPVTRVVSSYLTVGEGSEASARCGTASVQSCPPEWQPRHSRVQLLVPKPLAQLS